MTTCPECGHSFEWRGEHGPELKFRITPGECLVPARLIPQLAEAVAREIDRKRGKGGSIPPV